MTARTILAMIECDGARTPDMLRGIRPRLTGRREIVFPATSGRGEGKTVHLWCLDKALAEKLDAVIALQDQLSSSARHVIEVRGVYEAPYENTLEVVDLIRRDEDERTITTFDETWATLVPQASEPSAPEAGAKAPSEGGAVAKTLRNAVAGQTLTGALAAIAYGTDEPMILLEDGQSRTWASISDKKLDMMLRILGPSPLEADAQVSVTMTPKGAGEPVVENFSVLGRGRHKAA